MLSRADAALVRRDPTLPGLAIVLDPDALAATLRRLLPAADVGTARGTYVRYKRGTSCLVAYRLEAAGAVVDVHAKAHRPDAEDKLRKVRVRPARPGPLGPGRVILEDRAVAVSVFPNDRGLKALPRLADPERREGLLRRLVPRRPGLWGGAMRRLRYKPERRYVAQVLAEDGASAALKLYDEASFGAAPANQVTLESRGPLRLAGRLGRSKRHRLLAFEWLPGRPLSEALSDPAFEAEAAMTVGAALAELHGQEPAGLASLTREEEAATLLALAPEIGFVCPDLAERARDLAERLAARLLREPPVNRPIHGDFYAAQVLLDGDTAAILDLDRAVRGDPAADLGLFVAHLERDALRGGLRPSHVEPLRDALLGGYRAAAPGASPARVDLYTAVGLLQLAPDPFRYRDPEWPERTDAILARAEAILETVAGHAVQPR
jgi:hypothetical protein